MTAQEYIVQQLKRLNLPTILKTKPQTNDETVEIILKFLLSKKFRKFSVPPITQKILRTAIQKNITNKEPIKITWPFGGYKLWRFEEAPEVDWAELFSMMYFISWLKPICDVYREGIIFTFWFDEVIISQMNNIPQTDLDIYQKSFNDILMFLQPYTPENMQFEIFLERAQYESNEVFQSQLKTEMERLAQIRMQNPQPLSRTAIQSIEMNVKCTPEQTRDPSWKEKVDLMHYAYYAVQERQSLLRPSYTTENITAFSTFFEPNVIPIGTTKTSIVKFWVGVGALQRRKDSFIETILSPSQLVKAQFVWESVKINGLEGKNFNQIRVTE